MTKDKINELLDKLETGEIYGHKFIFLLEDIISQEIDNENNKFQIDGIDLKLNPIFHYKLYVRFGDREVIQHFNKEN